MYEKLLKIQNELKVPKGQYNDFGKYKYRSCEDILEALKPLLLEAELFLYFSDEIIEVNGRNYVKSKAILVEVKGDKQIEVSACAREEEVKKGMDGSQITGAASSYARKYALNGLFAIDDTKDSDFTNKSDKETTKTPIRDILTDEMYNELVENKGFKDKNEATKYILEINKTYTFSSSQKYKNKLLLSKLS